MSQSKSDDNWVQDALDDSCEAFQLTREEVRETEMLRREGFNAFADAYYDYPKLEKEEGSLGYTMGEFCKKKVLNIDFLNEALFTYSFYSHSMVFGP